MDFHLSYFNVWILKRENRRGLLARRLGREQDCGTKISSDGRPNRFRRESKAG